MSQFNSTTPTKPWNIYYTSSPESQAAVSIGREEAPWKSFGTSMSAISFGFVATAILISMFLIMAIFEHLFRPNDPSSSFSSPQDTATNLVIPVASATSLPPTGHLHKLRSTHMVEAESSYGSSDYSVVMPGHQFPSYIAQPAPLPPPCSRERISWPSHA
ncbi:hypothetical protein LINGRAHAP2_LOCUS13720 [Linum grandiflorum]